MNKLLKCSLLMAVAGTAFGASTLSDLVSNLNENLEAVAQLFRVVAYVAGVGFFLAGVLQFKAHRDNPAQVPLSKPLVYIGVAAGLLFLPTILDVAGETIFGGDKQSAKDADAV